MTDHDALMRRLVSGPWDKHLFTARITDTAPFEAAVAIAELSAQNARLRAERDSAREELRALYRAALAPRSDPG